MIRINVDKKKREEIARIFLEDAKDAQTGLFNKLTDQNVKTELKTNHKELYNRLYNAYSGELREDEVERLLLADRRDLIEYIDLFGDYEGNKKGADTLLKQVFRYDRFSKRKAAYEILQKMDVTVCPYCNRQYIFTVASGKVRPQFDHYYPKSKYPYLALSLHNMIPSCSICNMAKASLDTVKQPVLYPYDEEFGFEAEFGIVVRDSKNYTKVLQGVSKEFKVILEIKDGTNSSIIRTQMEKLHLYELYNQHADYVMDIIRSNYINTPERINEIYKKFPKLFRSREEVKDALYMTSTQKELWGKRPLSKLTYDIDKQLKSGAISLEVKT